MRTAGLHQRGVVLDRERLRFETARRAISQRRLAYLAHVNEVTLSRIANGHPCSLRTLAKITDALSTVPILVGADSIVLAPEKESTAASTSAVLEEVSRASGHPRR
ncbi:MAG TPA: hypothetical protein VNF26_08225 [Candidatus Baltobacterales bacterium]|nr:hypothetical protein [Candidatus Baltobacterales bacterium]